MNSTFVYRHRAELGQDDKGNLIVVSPIDGFPASKAGLRPQDMIVSINGTTTNDMTIDEAVGRIRGEKGTKVTLRILRGKAEDLSFTIQRDEIKIPSVKWEMLDGNVGSIRINQFGPDTAALSVQAARDLKTKGAKSILLDLRGNPGGLLSAAVEVSSLCGSGR
jgi:carboxyl-terminal processing protease